MGMNVATMSGNAEPQILMDVNTTPLIDVMLVLLVMLILTIPIQQHGINLFMGGSTPINVQKPVVHTVAIDFDGAVTWDGQALANPAAIEAKMREVGALAVADQHEVHIQANRTADYGSVAAVMASAQRNNVQKMGVMGTAPAGR